MVWINSQHYNAKSYPPEAHGGAMCTCPECQKKYWGIKTPVPEKLLKRWLELEANEIKNDRNDSL